MLAYFRLMLTFAVMLAAAAPGAARAQAKLEAQYTATLAGIPIGKGTWVINITDTRYMAAASGTTTGLIRAFIGGQGTSVAHGTLQAGRPLVTTYEATIVTSKKNDEIHLTINNGNVKDSKVDPPIDNDSERVPITEEHQKGILDPMTAALMRSPGSGDMLTPEACPRKMSIFDGRLRYDLQISFKRMDKVKADKGYAGPVVVCAVLFEPIAGHIPSRAAIKYITEQRDMEVWLAPIAGTRVLVPFRAQSPTPVGKAVIEATQFVSTPIPTRASANGVKPE